MGSQQSQPEAPEPYEAAEMTEDMQKVLDDNTFWPTDDSKYPYFLIQLDEEGELPCGESGILMSDCIAAWLASNPATHIIAQTHGWNTPRKLLLSTHYLTCVSHLFCAIFLETRPISYSSSLTPCLDKITFIFPTP